MLTPSGESCPGRVSGIFPPVGSVVLAALLPYADQTKTFQVVDVGRGLSVRQDCYSAKSSWCPMDGQMGPHRH